MSILNKFIQISFSSKELKPVMRQLMGEYPSNNLIFLVSSERL